MLDVPATAEIGGEELPLVRDTVPVGIGVFPDVRIVRALRENGVGADWHRESGEGQLVDEDGVSLVDAVIVDVFVSRDAAGRRQRIRSIRVVHVGAQFGDVHASVAVERDRPGLGNVRLREDQLNAIPGLQLKVLLLFVWLQWFDRRFWRVVDAGIGWIVTSWPAEAAAATSSGDRGAGRGPVLVAHRRGHQSGPGPGDWQFAVQGPASARSA